MGLFLNSPLGILAPGFMHVAEYMGSMCDDLEGNSQEYGFLGFKTCLEIDDSTSNVVEVHCYFRTYESIA